MRAIKLLPVLLVLLSLVKPAHAQVAEAAVGSDRHLWVGAEGSSFNPDYNHIAGRLTGVGVYGDYLVSHLFGLEGEGRLMDFNKIDGQTQKFVAGGPIVNVYHYRGFIPFVKVLLGAAAITYPYQSGTKISIGSGSYFAFVPGGGIDYRFNSRFKIRGEYEYELIPSAPGFPGQPSNGLTPTGYSAGVSYRIF